MTPNDIKADKRYRKLYNITLAEYNEKLIYQHGGCAICGRKPKRNRLAVDHNHAVEKAKIIVSQSAKTKIYTANALGFTHSSLRKDDAVNVIRMYLKRKSVRGLLCMICNRKILGSLERFKVKPIEVYNYLKKYDPLNELIK